jgi:hypothetical protein
MDPNQLRGAAIPSRFYSFWENLLALATHTKKHRTFRMQQAKRLKILLHISTQKQSQI